MEVYQRWTLMFCVTWKPTGSFLYQSLSDICKLGSASQMAFSCISVFL